LNWNYGATTFYSNQTNGWFGLSYY
jgi:hypothetical protein